MKLLNKKHSVTLVLENCESINVDVEFEKLDVTRVEMIFDDCYEFNYVENAKFKIARDDLKEYCEDLFTIDDKNLTYEERLLQCPDICQVWFNNQYIRQHLVGNKEETLYMVWNNDDDYVNKSYTTKLDKDYLYIETESLRFSDEEKEYIKNSKTKKVK